MRKIVAVFLGAVIGSLVLFGVGMIANAIQPTPPELMDPATAEAVVQRVAATSTAAWISTIFGLGPGSFIGGALAVWVARERIVRVTIGVALVLSLWAFYTFYVVYPAVLWVPISILGAVYYYSYLGGKWVRYFQSRKAS